MATALTHHIEGGSLEGWEARTLVSADGATRVVVVPELGMLTWSLNVEGTEYLGQPNPVTAFAKAWATTGIPLLHPWANRLGGDRLLGTSAPTIVRSPLIPRDPQGLPIHGINLAGAGWQVVRESADSGGATVVATLDFSDQARLALFPFPHRLAVAVTLRDRTYSIITTLEATGAVAVPVAFGWHPYLQLPGVPRPDWQVAMPAGQRVVLDDRLLPTAASSPFVRLLAPLGADTFDDLFTGFDRPATFVLEGGGHRVRVHFGRGFDWAQVYAPADRALIAFEPMTAPGNALVSGRGLRWIPPGSAFTAMHQISVCSPSS